VLNVHSEGDAFPLAATAASIFRSSASITSMISADVSLSMLSVAGLMASVGNCCHLTGEAWWGTPGSRKTRRQILAPGPAPVKRPRCRTRPSGLITRHTAARPVSRPPARGAAPRGQHGGELRPRPRPPGGVRGGGGTPRSKPSGGGSSRPSCRSLISDGLAPRSAARARGQHEGLFRFLVARGPPRGSPAEDLHGGRPWPALPRYLTPDEVDRLIEQPDAARPLGQRDRNHARGALSTGLRVSELVALKAAESTCRAGVPHHHRQGRQAARRAARRPRGGRHPPVTSASPGRAGPGRAPPRGCSSNGRGGALSRLRFWKILKNYVRKAGARRT